MSGCGNIPVPIWCYHREKEETDQLEKGIVNDEYICKESNRLIWMRKKFFIPVKKSERAMRISSSMPCLTERLIYGRK